MGKNTVYNLVRQIYMTFLGTSYIFSYASIIGVRQIDYSGQLPYKHAYTIVQVGKQFFIKVYHS